MNVTDFALLRALPELAVAWRSQWWPRERLERAQMRRLERVLQHAIRHVPHYRGMSVVASHLPPQQALHSFPFLTKSDVQTAGTRLLATGYDPARLPSSRTSGSTGEPTTTWFDQDGWRLTRHVLKWRRVLAAVRPWRLRLLSVSESRESTETGLSGVLKMRALPAEMPAADALHAVLMFRPTAIYAFPSWLREVIEAARLEAVALPRAECIMTSSEVLSEADRTTISRAFGASIQDVYGTTEFKDVAWQCEAGRYHVNTESVWVEIDAARGEIGEIVLTGLANRAMPLIRFRTGDLARWDECVCSCGRAAPALADIQGRVTEMMELPGGRRLSPYALTTAIESDESVRRYLIEQHDASHVVIRYRERPGRRVQKAELLARARSLLGPDVSVDCVPDAQLEPSARGKRSIYRRLF